MTAIAIDGPAGAGKSTIAKAVSKKLGFIYVDTGALYRAIALNAIETDTNISDEQAVGNLLKSTNVELVFRDGVQLVLLNGCDVSDKIRTPRVSMAASAVSALPVVRAFLLDLQRSIAQKNNVIMDGRDIGTVVLPDAKVKIFLTASAKCRADRRYKELCEKGENVEYEDVLNDIKTRDYNDSHREIAPLKPAPDSITADTSDDTLEQAIQRLLKIIEERI